jgi:hypothetical protein
MHPGHTISMNAEWFRGQLKGEARGAVVHEMVHVVQGYSGRNRGGRRFVAPPGWIVEGIPDYIRWFLFEPETGGAKLSAERLKDAKHDASYRTSANFIDWVIRNIPTMDTFWNSSMRPLEKAGIRERHGRNSPARPNRNWLTRGEKAGRMIGRLQKNGIIWQFGRRILAAPDEVRFVAKPFSLLI